ncbi:hypothetical protein M422DRAFT_266724 [Sphaerobolus stellatus SS14]|uniref:Uncharacterized protein n=1 Tax=Sphaerobolus stellatus (strain SS14) TaxID=990650 RepID=A0A0C9UAM0_SPHS4|nr:hypothetical protein M422DRAFT_266724 [Sphaerobolus stellatus SS14]
MSRRKRAMPPWASSLPSSSRATISSPTTPSPSPKSTATSWATRGTLSTSVPSAPRSTGMMRRILPRVRPLPHLILSDSLPDTNRTRLIRKAHPTDSFNFFSPPIPPSKDTLENGEIDEEELDDLEERLGLDYQIGEDLKERVRIPSLSHCPILDADSRSFPALSTGSLARPSNTKISTWVTKPSLTMKISKRTAMKRRRVSMRWVIVIDLPHLLPMARAVQISKLGAPFSRVRADPALSRASETSQMNRQCSRITQDRPGHQAEFTDAPTILNLH